jgi:hypothetical protein
MDGWIRYKYMHTLLTNTVMKFTVFWNMMLYSFVDMYHCFGGSCHLYLQHRGVGNGVKVDQQYTEGRTSTVAKIKPMGEV